jgi:hypothetical protein
MEHVDISNEIVNEHNKLIIQISQMKNLKNNEKNHVGINVPKTCKYDDFHNTIHNCRINKKENNNYYKSQQSEKKFSWNFEFKSALLLLF